MDSDLLRQSFARVAPRAADFVGYFYAHLFLHGGEEVIDMFPPLMGAQRDRLVRALVRIVGDVDNLDSLVPYLAGLGRDHRKFTVQPDHYALVGNSLLAALERFDDGWTADVAEVWTHAYSAIAGAMLDGARADEGSPPWWDAEVTAREMRGPSVALLRLHLDQPVPYEPGQSVAVQFPRLMPGVWRFYSPAHPPECLPEMTFHVKVEGGGLLSPMLGLRAEPGDRLRLGPPVGSLRLRRDSDRDIAAIAGSTGLAPLLSIIRAVAQRDTPPRVHLFFGARTPWDLYLLPELEKMAAQHPWLTVTPAVMDAANGSAYEGAHGSVVDVAAKWGDWRERDMYVCGPAGMVSAAVTRLSSLGIPGGRIHTEDYG